MALTLNTRLILISSLATLLALISRSNSVHGNQREVSPQQSSPQAPTIYVIQPESDQKASGSWNSRQTLVARQFGANQQQAPATSGARSAKQVQPSFDGDELVPFYGAQQQHQHQRQYQRRHMEAAVGQHEAEQATAEFTWNQVVSNDQEGELDQQAPAFASMSSAHQYRATATKGRQGGAKRRASGRRATGAGTKGHRSPASRRKQPAAAPPPGDVARAWTHANNATTPARRAGPRNKARKNLVCYYGTWAVYRPDAGRYPVENIDPFLCTHIIYGFTGLSYDNLIKPLDPWNDLEDNYGKGAMKRFTNLKRINPDLKTLVAIGGWNEGSIKYSKMASDPEARGRFVKSVVDFLDRYNFDGLDLDWEYPGARGGASYDKPNFVRLLRELKEAFAPRQYLLTAAVSAGKWFIDPAYDIAQVSKYLDLINLMAYDYHGGWETKTGHNAPLFSSARHDRKEETLLNVNWSVNYWLQQGAPAEKIMLGVGSYGRSFTLDKASENGINAPASQKGQAGPYTREPGSLGYNEICEAFQRQPNAWTVVRDPDYLAPYAYNDRQWVGYDDMESLALKAQFAKSMGLGGMMMWSIETDDFQGRCHNEKYPLLNTIKRVMSGEQQPGAGSRPPRPPTPGAESTTGRPTVRPPATPTTSTPGLEVEDEPKPAAPSTTGRPQPQLPPSSSRPRPPASSTTSRRPQTVAPVATTPRSTNVADFDCRADGMFADPSNCRKFVRCVSSGGGRRFSIYKFDCGPGTAFNEAQQYCDHIYNVPSCASSSARQPNRRLELEREHHQQEQQQQQLQLQTQPQLQHQQVNWSFQHHHIIPHQRQLQVLAHGPVAWQHSSGHYVY